MGSKHAQHTQRADRGQHADGVGPHQPRDIAQRTGTAGCTRASCRRQDSKRQGAKHTALDQDQSPGSGEQRRGLGEQQLVQRVRLFQVVGLELRQFGHAGRVERRP
jgi:hypothetical protein